MAHTPSTSGALPPVEHRASRINDFAVLAILALAVTLLHIFTNGQYGFHRDELDTIDSARHLAWGYVAYPPFTPFVGWLGLSLFGPSLIGLRAFSALAMGIVVLLSGLMARDLGGRRPAQIVAALAVAIAPMAMIAALMLHYLSFDYLWWVVVAFCIVRLLTTGDERWWLGAGAAIGLGMMTKFTIIFLVAGVVVGVLLTPARRQLRSPWLWGGVLVALAIYLPNLIWQAQHGFISLEFLSRIHQRDIAWGRTSGFIEQQFFASTNPITVPLWIAGLIYYFSPAGKRYRMLGWMFVTPFVLLYLAQGRFYYMAPAYPMLMAAGAAWGERWLARGKPIRRWVGGGVVIVALLLGGAVAVLFKPIFPIDSPVFRAVDQTNDTFREMIGWPELAGVVAGVYQALPAAEQAQTAILTANYGEYGALQLYGPAYGLPPVIGGTNSEWERGYGDPPPETVIVVGYSMSDALTAFATCHVAGRTTNPYNLDNEESQVPEILVCQDLKMAWPELWAKMRNFG